MSKNRKSSKPEKAILSQTKLDTIDRIQGSLLDKIFVASRNNKNIPVVEVTVAVNYINRAYKLGKQLAEKGIVDAKESKMLVKQLERINKLLNESINK